MMEPDDIETTWKATTMHCPNCGDIVCGYKNSDGTVKLQCSICGVNMVLKRMGRRHDRVDIYAPVGQARING